MPHQINRLEDESGIVIFYDDGTRLIIDKAKVLPYLDDFIAYIRRLINEDVRDHKD